VARLIALLVAGFAGGLGLGAWVRRRRRRRVEEPSPAEELRAKLAESRAADPEPVAEEAAEPDAVAEEVEPTIESDLESRRRGVHDRARGAIDELS